MLAHLKRVSRSLRSSPGYAIASIASVAIGLGLSTATFAFIESVRTTAPESPDAARIYTERLRFGGRNYPSIGDRVRALSTMAGVEGVAVSIRSFGAEVHTREMQRVRTVFVTNNYWQLQSVVPRLGRLPSDADAQIGEQVIVTDETWRREFNDRPSLDGATIQIGERIYSIAAVLPEQVRSNGMATFLIPLTTPAALDTIREAPYSGSATIVVKLKRGVRAGSMTAELERAAAMLTREHVRAGDTPYTLTLVPSNTPRFAPDSFLILMYLLGFGILAIGCSNVAALTLARGLMRKRDFALRLALGAPRRTIAREVFAEVGAVTLAGSVLGLGVTFALLGVLGRSMPIEMTWEGWAAPSLDVATLAYCAVAFLAAVVMGGTLPAIRAIRVAPNETLKDGAGTTTGRARSEFRLLLMGELAVAMVLIMMASLLTLSLRHVMTFEYGFPANSVVTANIRVGQQSYTLAGRESVSLAELAAWQQRSLEVARELPGVIVAGLGGGGVPAGVVISDGSGSGEPSLNTRAVRAAGAGYFTAMGIPIVAGRDFLEGDVTGRGGAILSASAALALFPYGGALGRMVKVGPAESEMPWVPVVGVAADHWTNPTDTPETTDPLVTLALPEQTTAAWTVVVRGDTAAEALVTPLRLALMDALPPRSTIGTSTFVQDFEIVVRAMTYFVQVFAALGFAALALGTLGLFSVMSYAVGQRSREFAVRVSLGATPSHVVRVVLRNTAELALGGAAIGALLSFWASAGVSAALFGIKNTDPVSLILSEALLIGACLLAGLGPALRAARANPLDVIRAV